MINQGKIENNRFIKRVSFSEAVLWKSREISLNPATIKKCKDSNVFEIWFEDLNKNERWKILLTDFINNSTLKTMHQERQWYCPISLFDREVIRKIEIKPISTVVEPIQKGLF